uniref:Triacylglycerol lipase n=1 Tax=Candidozyma auris TaxID=498019 RepID=A0A0L0NZF6_CANAR
MLPLVLLVLWSSLVLAFVLVPTPPSKDSFYNVPGDIANYKNGDIIKMRNTPVPVRSLIFEMNVKNAWQVLVRSEDSFGVPNAFVATILEPYNADPSKLWSYQAWQDANCIDCAPSYSLLYKASMDTITTQSEIPFIQYGLSKGWFVVVPDYQGPKSTFTAGRQSGKAVLNGVRAALNSGNFTGIDENAQVGLYGYSGGSLATGWAAQLQPAFAPELKSNIIGAAVGGWVTNITLTALACDGTMASGIIANAVNGIMSEYSMFDKVFERELNPLKKRKFKKAKDNCLLNSIVEYVFQKFFSGLVPYFSRRQDFFHVPEIAEIIKNNTAALVAEDGVPEIPMFVFHGNADEIVPMVQPTRGYENYCKWGAPSIEWTVSETTGHVIESFIGVGAAFSWLEKRFDGQPPVEGCQRTQRTSNLEYPGADVAYRQVLNTYVRGIFGAEIGEDTIDIDESTWLSKIILYGFSKFLGLIGPIPIKREETVSIQELAGNRTVDELYKGFLDVKNLMQAKDIDPIRVLEGEEPTI